MISSGYEALEEFKRHWGLTADSDGLCRFLADVDYKGTKHSAVETTKASVSVRSDDRPELALDEAGALTSPPFHLRFSPDIHDFEFASGDLIVSGDDYALTISIAD